MDAYERETGGEGLGDIYVDRAYGEWPLILGREVSEEEARAAARRWPREGMGDVFSDRIYGEWPLLWGYEVTEEEPQG